VEVGETFTGGQEPGLRGGRARGKKVLTGIAVEVSAPKGIGRCRMAVLADASAESLNPFVTGAVEPGSTIITEGGRCRPIPIPFRLSEYPRGWKSSAIRVGPYS
jgi:hypothetical protein